MRGLSRRVDSSVWVFSPTLDMVSFLAPLLLAAALAPLAALAEFQPGYGLIFYSFAIGLMIDHGHVYGTFVPVFLDQWRKGLLGARVWLVPAAVLAGGLSLSLYSVKAFSTVLSYLAIFHVCRQQYGWLAILERRDKGASRAFRHLDRLFFLCSILVPIYYWQADLSVVLRRYFSDGDMRFLLPNVYWPVARAIHHAIFTTYVLGLLWRLWRGPRLALGKHLFLIANWIWFYGGLVLSPYMAFFWITLIVCHGVSYHIHINSYWRSSFGGDLPSWFTRHSQWQVPGYLLFIFLAGSIYTGALNWLHLPQNWFLPIGNLFLVSHYFFDALIWRKSYRPQLQPAGA